MDHFHIEVKDDLLEFDDANYTERYTIPFYLFGDNVYIGLYTKAVTGTIYIRFTVTDSVSATATDTQNTALTSWQQWTDSNRFDIDTSSLTEGSATLKMETKGDGQLKDVYYLQE